VGEAVPEGCAVSWDAVAAGCGGGAGYVTRDWWESRVTYEQFREKFAKEYGELDRECEGIMAREKHLSEYEDK
jgi:hypothetical protein